MRKKWKVYLPFMENEFKRNLAYKGSFYLFMLCGIFAPFINYYLWMAIYGSSSGSMLGGLTKNEMVVYVFMSYITTQMVFVSISDYIGDHVMEGSVAMNLIKPIDYRMSLLSQAMGTMLYRFLAPTIFVWIGVEIYKAKVLGMGITPLPNILCYIVSVLMSFLIYVLFDFCFGMVAFVTTYMYGMQLIKEALIGFLSGELIPISFFPVVMQKAFDFMPFSSMVYAPVMLYLGKYSGGALLMAMGRQLIWVILLYVLGSVLWQRITKRLVVLGG